MTALHTHCLSSPIRDTRELDSAKSPRGGAELRNHHEAHAKIPFCTQESIDTMSHISPTTTKFVTSREQIIAHLILSIGTVGWDSNLEPKLEKKEEVKSSSLYSVLHFRS